MYGVYYGNDLFYYIQIPSQVTGLYIFSHSVLRTLEVRTVNANFSTKSNRVHIFSTVFNCFALY